MSAVLNAPSSRTSHSGATPWLSRLRSVGWSVLILAALSLALMAWSQHRWQKLQQNAQSFEVLWAETQLATLQAQHSPDDTRWSEAIQAATQLRQTAPSGIRPDINRLIVSLQTAKQQSTSPFPDSDANSPQTAAPDLKTLQVHLDAVTNTWRDEMQEVTLWQQRTDHFTLALVASVTLALLALIARAQRQRQEAVGSLKARERQLRQKTRMYDFLSHVNQAIVRSETEAELLNRLCNVAVEQGQFRRAWVATTDPANALNFLCQTAAGSGHPTDEALSFAITPASVSTLDQSLIQGRCFRTADLARCANLPLWASQAIETNVPGCVTVPLYLDDTLHGHLILLGRRVSDNDADELSLFEELSDDLSLALTNLHRDALHHLAQERVRLHAAALESTRDGMMVLDRNHIFVSVNPAFSTMTGYNEHDVLGRTPDFLLPDQADETIHAIRATLVSEGAWQGEVWLRRKSGELFMVKMSLSAVRIAQDRPAHFVGMFTDITPLKETEERLAHMAHFDPLTDLPNRLMIHQRLSHALSMAERHHTLVGVLFIDLDNFKTVNDGLGHAAGDSLLKQVAWRLGARVRQEDTLGRLSSDEFILVLEHLRHPQQAAQMAASMLEALNEPFVLEDAQEIYVRASIGISLYPQDGTQAADLIRHADAAMYESKRRGRNNYNFYTESFTTLANNRLQMETRLRRAVEYDEFSLHYQPMIDLATGKIVALEALVRLNAPSGSDASLPSIGPGEFIPVMEETGMIVALGEWVLTEACRQGKTWLDEGREFGRIAVNLSPSEIRRGGVIERIARILGETGLPPEHLEIEITESGLMESGTSAEQFLLMLYQLGVSLSIDDFGTGYSSLAYLKRFPVHQLKIDRSFIQDTPHNLNDCQLVSTMISLAHSLHMTVVAEGVEEAEQVTFLSGLGCNIAQGYHYSRPLPPNQVVKMLPLTETLQQT